VEVFRVRPVVLWVTVFLALLMQTVLPLGVPQARVIDFPLLVTIYFALMRRNKIFGIGLGTVVGLCQDALSHHYIGLYGMAKALVGYLAASASVKFELEELLSRFVLAGFLILAHGVSLLGLEHGLLENPPPLSPLNVGVSVMFNVAPALVLFHFLDRLRHPV
jgi:rod shape-determining protein MreD